VARFKYLKRWIGNAGEIDFRSLLLFRVTFFSVFAFDLLQRLVRMDLYYLDSGMLSRVQALLDRTHWFVHPLLFTSTNNIIVTGFFLLAVGACGLIIFGVHTRWSIALLWLIWASIIDRNRFVNDGSSALRGVILFWSLFLPWQQLEAWISLTPSKRVMNTTFRSLAGFGLIFQIACIYFFSSLLKSGSYWYDRPLAMSKMFSYECVATPVAQAMLRYPVALAVLTRGTKWIEILGPIFLLSNFRLVGLVPLLLLHLGIIVFLNLGVFPVICIAMLLVCLPSSFWTGQFSLPVTFGKFSIILILSVRTWLCNILYSVKLALTSATTKTIFLSLSIGFIILLNLKALFEPAEKTKWMSEVGHILTLNQRWRFFAPKPPEFDFWFVAAGEMIDGELVDLFKRPTEPISWKKPVDFRDKVYPDEFKRKYFEKIKTDGGRGIRLRAYGDYLCRHWKNDGLKRLEIYELSEPFDPASGNYQKIKLLERECTNAR
jgi:hypothetical protein